MSRLRKTIQRSIIDLIDTTVFTSDDFLISFGSQDELVHIKLKYNESYYYLIRVSAIGSYPTTRTPGEVVEIETRVYESLDKSLSFIPEWCIEVRNELRAESPIYKQVDDLQKKLNEHLENYSNSEEFTVAEINHLIEKFKEFEKRIEALEAENIITKLQAEEMKKGVAQVAQDIEYYPKATWIKTAANKITKIFVGVAKSPEGSKLLADGARKLLSLD